VQTGAAELADRRSGQKGYLRMLTTTRPATPGAANLRAFPNGMTANEWRFEKEVLGYYLTSHPLAEHEETFRLYTTHTPAAVATVPHRTEVVLGGMLSAVKFSHTKNPRPGTVNTKYAMFDLEGLDGILRCIVWRKNSPKHGPLVPADSILVVCGHGRSASGKRRDKPDRQRSDPMDQLAARYTRGIEIRLQEDERAVERLERLHEILRGYPGSCGVQLLLSLADGSQISVPSGNTRVAVQRN